MSGGGRARRGSRRAGTAVAAFGAFLWDFVVGDDWVGALGVAALLAVGAVLDHVAHVRAWWMLPPGVALLLSIMVRRATRAASASAAAAQVRAPHHQQPPRSPELR